LEIKYSKKKEELRHDPILETILGARSFVAENSNTILSAAIVVLLVVGGFAAYSYVKKAGQRRASEAFGKAMIALTGNNRDDAVVALSLVADKHRNSPQAAYAAFMLGSVYLDQGDYDEAVTWLDVAANHKKAGFVAGEALEALATCFEAKQDLEQAVEYLQRALKTKSVAYRYPALRWKLALLSQQMGRDDEVRRYCTEILSDTLATQYRQKAENLLAAAGVS
jgi:hypothetical protein